MIPGNDLKARVEYFADWDYNLKISGVKFRQSELGELYGEDWNELMVDLQHEPENKFDKNAIAIWVNRTNTDSVQIGYIPAMVAPHLLEKINAGIEYQCALMYITSGSHGKIRTGKIAIKEKDNG